MNQTLIIYDDGGKIFVSTSGDFITPIGLQHIITEVPEGKRLAGVNVETHEPIFDDFPKTEVELLREQLRATQEAVDFLLLNGGL